MMQKVRDVGIVIIGFVILVTANGYYKFLTPPATTPTPTATAPALPDLTTSLKNGIYLVDGTVVTLVNGVSKVAAAPGSASMITTQYFGNQATGDLNGDGQDDAAFILTQSGGGSGTFYYIVAALATAKGYEGTNAILLGDRIAPQTTQIQNGEIVVSYADRNPTDPMTTAPSVGVTKYFKIQDNRLVEAPVVASSEQTQTPLASPHQTACVMDAQECPDGTYVARVAPSCDFAPCPGTQ